jgi:hypothetical protein
MVAPPSRSGRASNYPLAAHENRRDPRQIPDRVHRVVAHSRSDDVLGNAVLPGPDRERTARVQDACVAEATEARGVTGDDMRTTQPLDR